mmetsp:Transcript_10391/g.32041  ORF Transcript_10391/g.32041 Transcript_10391/m.32041 type:complete len:270 (-) Transcript_10391:10-819(-)
MSSFRAASLVSVTELTGLVDRLVKQREESESHRAQLAMRLSASSGRDEKTQGLLAQTEISIRDVKIMIRELEGEKTKLVAAREAARLAKDADRRRRAPAPATKAGTKLGKYVVPAWIAGRTPALLEASKDGKALQTIDLAKRDVFVLGRQPELCHVTLEHASVSRQHVVIIHGSPPGKAEGWYLVDLGSAHGTGISLKPGEKMSRLKPDDPQPLAVGATFRIGKSSRVYAVKEDARRAKRKRDDAAPAGAPADPKRAKPAGGGDDDASG